MKNSIIKCVFSFAAFILSTNAYSVNYTFNNGWGGSAPTLTKNDVVTVTAGTWTVSSSTILGALILDGGNLAISNELKVMGSSNTPITVNGTSSISSSSASSKVGALTINSGGELTFSGSMLQLPSVSLNGGKLYLASSSFDISNGGPASSPDLTVTANSSIIGNGTVNRLILNGSRLTLNGGALTIDNAEVIVKNLTFSTAHDIQTINSGLMAFDNSNHSISGASSNSHIIGTIRVYLQSNSQTAYDWPLGDGTTLATVRVNPTTKDVNNVNLTNVSGAYGTHYIDITYFGRMSTNLAIDTTLKSVSGAEYWMFSRSSTQPTAKFGFYVNSGVSKTIVTSNNISNELDLALIDIISNKWTFLDGIVTSSGGTNVLVTTSQALEPNKVITFGTNSPNTSFLAPLPVSIIDFSAKANDKNIEVKWSTASEKDNAAFVVEKSIDGQVWSSIGTMNGAKTSNVVNNYGLVDFKAVAGVQYYRLKQIDLDGTVSYSKAIAVNFSKASMLNVNLFPNPAKDALNITAENNASGELNIQILNSMGETVYNQVVEAGLVQTIDIASFIPGVYYVTVIAEGETKIIRLLKN